MERLVNEKISFNVDDLVELIFERLEREDENFTRDDYLWSENIERKKDSIGRTEDKFTGISLYKKTSF